MALISDKKELLHQLKDYFMIVVGLALYAFGFTAFILPEKVVSGGLAGVSSLVYFKFGIPVAITNYTLNVLLLIVVIRFDPGRIGAGTVANMVFVGYIAEFFMDVFDRFPALSAMTLPVRMAVFVPTMALFLLAASIYMVVDLGVAPYDGVPQIIAAHARRMSFRTVRMCWDVGALTLGFLLGSTVGLTTVVTGFCLGPAIAAVGDRVKGFYEEG